MIPLLAVNLLYILHNPLHPDFQRVNQWFRSGAVAAFATCPITQSGMMRLLVKGVAGLDQFDMKEARRALQRLIQLPGHVYWPDAPDWLSATQSLFPRMQGHRQTTDAYLLGLAIHNKGKLATLDRGIRHLAGTKFSHLVELIS
jgi:toxin-antitoxin system PIN domain toxin